MIYLLYFSCINYETSNSEVIVNMIFFLFKDIDPNEKISEESEEAFVDLVLKLIDCQKVSIELAIMLGKSFVKIYLMKKPLEFEEWILDLIESRKTSFGKLCLVTGSLNHGPNNAHFHDRLFGYVMTCCSSTTSHDFQSFQALKIWSSKLKLSRSEILMEEKSDRLQSLLNLINSNWGSSLKGITELLTDTLQNVLQMVNSPQVDRELLENSLKCLSWKTKAKYSLLAVILPRIGVIKILENKPNFGSGLSESLSTNYMAPAGASLYKVIVKTANVLESWKKHILPHLLHSLCHDKSSLVRTNAKNHWLRLTQAYLPKEASISLIENLCPCDQCSASHFAILKGLRTNGYLHELTKNHVNSLKEGLNHSSSDVRLSAFAVICQVRKKGMMPTNEELNLAKNFIIDNLSVDEPSFRQVGISVS